jgi:hypothetical protein
MIISKSEEKQIKEETFLISICVLHFVDSIFTVVFAMIVSIILTLIFVVNSTALLTLINEYYTQF